jgi:RpiR family transcriptional regulator, carbohydrate utilization regulator
MFPEDTDVYMPMVSRIAQLTLIDVPRRLALRLRRGAKFRDNLKRVKEALKESRFDKGLALSPTILTRNMTIQRRKRF